MFVKTYRHGLGHCLRLGQALLHEYLELYAHAECRDRSLQILRDEAVGEDIHTRHVGLDVGLRIAQYTLLEERRNEHHGMYLSLAYELLTLVHIGYTVPNGGLGSGIDHLRQRARERRMVLVQHRYGQIVRNAILEYHREEGERYDGQHREQHHI